METILCNVFTQGETELLSGIKVKDFLRLHTYTVPLMDGKKQKTDPATGKKCRRALTEAEKASLYEVKINTSLIKILEAIRQAYPQMTMGINDHGGYRPNAPIDLNAAVGGAKGSRHRFGSAADFYMREQDGSYMDTAVLAVAVERIMNNIGICGGVGFYPGKSLAIHVDSRPIWAAWFHSYDGRNCPHQGGIYTLFHKGHEAAGIVLIQRRLIALGYRECGAADGRFGAKTEAALRRFQKDRGIKADGLYGRAANRALGALPW